MLAHHLFGSAEIMNQYGAGGLIPTDLLATASHHFGKICVSVFIFLSGYGMTKSYNNRISKIGTSRLNAGETTRFILKRYISLEGGFLFVYLLSLIVITCCNPEKTASVYAVGNGNRYPVVGVIADALGLAYGFSTPSLNGTWWYMTIAFTAVLILPIAVITVKRYGAFAYLLPLLAVPFLGVHSEMISAYLSPMLLGVAAAENDWLVKLKNWTGSGQRNERKNKPKATVRVIKCFAVLALIIVFGYWRCTSTEAWIVDRLDLLAESIQITALSFLLVYFCFDFISGGGEGLSSAMAFIGRHATNIFLVHTFIQWNYATDEVFIYGLRYPLLIFIGLLGLSLAASIIIEQLKRLTRYDRLLSALRRKAAGQPGKAEQGK